METWALALDTIIHNYVLNVEMMKSSRNMWTCVHKVLTSSCWPPATLRVTGGGLNQEGQSGARRSGHIVFNPLASGDWSFLNFILAIFSLKNEVQ